MGKPTPTRPRWGRTTADHQQRFRLDVLPFERGAVSLRSISRSVLLIMSSSVWFSLRSHFEFHLILPPSPRRSKTVRRLSRLLPAGSSPVVRETNPPGRRRSARTGGGAEC